MMFILKQKLSRVKKIGLGLIILNFIVNRVFCLNFRVPFSVHFTSKIICPENITFKKDTTTLVSFAVSGNCYIQAVNGIVLGDNFLFAPGVKIISANHDFENKNKPISTKPIVIGNNVWLGTNSVILAGVEIADNCIVGANSVVTKSFLEPNSIIAGNPAKIVRVYK